MIDSRELREMAFDTKHGRYDAKQVDACLEQAAAALEALAAERDALKRQNEQLTARVEQYIQMEDALRGALVNAQKIADETLQQAREDAQEITAQADKLANERVEGILSQARAELAALRDMKAIVASYKRQVRELMSRQLDLLEQYCEDDQTPQVPQAAQEPAAVEEPVRPLQRVTSEAPREEPRTVYPSAAQSIAQVL